MWVFLVKNGIKKRLLMTITTLNCDCMEYMKTLADNAYSLAIVDPPYGIGITNMRMGSRLTVKPDSSKKWDSQPPDDDYFNELFRVSKNQIIWGGNYFNLPLSKYFAVWDKGEALRGRSFAECEMAWVRSGGTRIFKTHAYQPTRIHPTQKPTKLYDWLLKTYATKGDNILDTHGGSFSSAISAYNAGFDMTICELDQEYYNAGVARFNDETQQKCLF